MVFKKIIFLGLLMTLLPLSNVHVNAAREVVHLDVTIDDPMEDQGKPQRNPVEFPEVAIEDYTLYFDAACYGCTLRLVDVDDNVVYTTIITGDTLVLPSTLSGTYELQIVQGFYCFFGTVTF